MMPATASNRVLRLLFWETTIRCNLACAHCRRLESNDTGAGDLSTPQAETLIEQLAQLGRRQPQMPVLVFSGGEPLCRQDLFHLIDQARQNGLITALATNGTMIDEEQARRVRDNGVARVSVSLDGANAEVHDRMRQIPGAFDGALAGIRHLREQQVPFQVNVTLTKQNVGQLQQVHDLARSLGAAALHIFMLVPVGCGQVLAQTEMLSPEQYEHILREIHAVENRGEIQVKVTCGPHYERVKRQLARSTGVPPMNIRGSDRQDTRDTHGRDAHATETPHGVTTNTRPQSRGCLAGLGVLFVSHRGDVYPCGYLPVNCGNVVETRLTEIWDANEDLARLRDAGALEGKCGICEYKQVCGGCRARAFGVTGNYLGEEPFCAYHPPAVTR
jgi:radical SAM protein with 4Fe4S-binding SPASM domain